MLRVAPLGKRGEVRVASTSEAHSQNEGGKGLQVTVLQQPPHRFLDLAVGLARNDTFFVHSNLSSRPEEQSDEVEGSIRLAKLAQDKPVGWVGGNSEFRIPNCPARIAP